MWAFFSRRLRAWLVLAVVAPLLGWLLGKVGDLIEARRGANGLTKTLQSGRAWLGSHARGPFAARSGGKSGQLNRSAPPPSG